MPCRAIEFRAGEYYHLYNRGHNHQVVFLERENYLFFLRQLRKYLRPDTIDIVAYCLMPTHYHLLVYLKTDNLGSLMQPFALSYTKAFNKRYGRAGALFQGRYRAALVDRDEYLVHLSRYIHLNPVEADLVKHPQEWEFSSYPEFAGTRGGTLPRSRSVLAQFDSSNAYRKFVESAVESSENPIEHLALD